MILSLDWIDLGGSLRQACGGQWPAATVIQCSLDQYTHNGWSMDYQALPPADISMLATPDRLVGCCSRALGKQRRRRVGMAVATARRRRRNARAAARRHLAR